MDTFMHRPFALLVLLILANAASAQTMQQASPTNFTLASTDAVVLDMRRAKPLSRGEEAALKPSDRFRECDQCPEMVGIPDGSFIMGAAASEPGSTADERPRHRVDVQRFAVGRRPVTADEWQACELARGCSHRAAVAADRGADPVTGVLWEEARDYVQWLARATGRPYRLLSEAEREYVARAGTSTAFWWGDGTDPHLADATVAFLIADIGLSTAQTTAATPQFANPFGVLQVHGSVYDWVEDCWHDNYVGAPADGSAWITPGCRSHVLRGGALSRALQTRRAAARMWSASPNRLDYMSLRVARTFGP